MKGRQSAPPPLFSFLSHSLHVRADFPAQIAGQNSAAAFGNLIGPVAAFFLFDADAIQRLGRAGLFRDVAVAVPQRQMDFTGAAGVY